MNGRIAKRSLILVFALQGVAPALAADREFEITFSPQVRQQPYTGRVYLFFTKGKNREPRIGPNWLAPEPMVAVDIEGWKPGEPLNINTMISDWMLAFPKKLADLDLDGYRVQAVARFNPIERNVGTGSGNGYSAPLELPADTGKLSMKLTIDQIIPARPFPETKWCKLLAVRSKLLSDFHKREVVTQGSVLLPASYFDQPDRRYPVILEVPGFGGTHADRVLNEPVPEQNAGGVEFIRVMLDPSCPLGHHVFADSANNGPVGAALVKEFLPELDRQFRTVAAPTARFLTGHSSGGWSSLWLQITYPETFGGTWSTAPDPVDFRDFQRIDLYRAGENMYRDRDGNRRPIARRDGMPLLWYDDFDRMEELLGPGGQLHSFEAVFSPRGPGGAPVRAWNRKTGAVETAVADDWKKYDIRLILEARWKELGPRLAGKLHVFMGTEDTFYLDGATKLLKESLEKLGSDAVVEMFPGKDHGSLMTRELLTRMRGEIVEAYLKQHPAK